MRQMDWQSRLARTCWRRLCCLFVACSVLAGCTGKACLDSSDSGTKVYDGCLGRHESVTDATQVGPFTTLDISYSEPYGYLGAHLNYQRILYKGRILARQVDDVQAWTGLSSTVLFANIYEGDLSASRLHLIYERAGRPVIERVDIGIDGWVANYEFPYGYPLHGGVRYFPRYVGSRDAGFLLGVVPTRLTKLPLGPQGIRVPRVQSLAGIAPDGKAYAYTDSRLTPSAIAVVDADGAVRAPVPIPFTSLAHSVQPDTNPFEPIWRWFAATFTWQKDERGRWGIVPTRAPPAIPTVNPVEEPFIDAITGYQACFASDNPVCLKGWRFQQDSAAHFGDCCLSRYAYVPTEPTRAFEADVAAMVYSSSFTADSGYQLLLNALPNRVIAALTKRLRSRKVPFVRADECPNLASDDAACIARLTETIHWKNDTVGRKILSVIIRASEKHAVFMTPTVALAVYAGPHGQTWVETLARYDLGASAGTESKPKLGYIREVYHGS